MRLLIVGSKAEGAIEHNYVKYLRGDGVEVEIFSPAAHTSYSLVNRVAMRLGSLALFQQANRKLLDYIDAYRPEIVWVFKGIGIFPDTLKSIKKKGIKLANYNPDHPFIRTMVSHGGKNIEACVPLYDLHFCYSRELTLQIEKEYGIPAVWLPFGFDLDEAAFERIAQTEEYLRIGFIGNPDRLRARIISKLAATGMPVDVYGNQWLRFLRKHPNIRVFPAVYGDEFWQKIRQYRVQLNIFRPHNAGSHNMRSFEIPAAGGVMLAPDSPEHRAFFSHGEEAFFYRSEQEMTGYCHELLNRITVESIRTNARNKSTKEGYSYQHRAKVVFSSFEKLQYVAIPAKQIKRALLSA